MSPAKISTHWKKSYLSILYNGPKSEADWPAAAELLKAGYAEGQAIPRTDGQGAYAGLIWRGLTVSGRLFCDELEGAVYRASWRFKLKMAGITFASWCVGFISGIAADWLKSSLF